jgi:hypothetical protein
MSGNDAMRRLAVLEDIEAIKRLKAQYCAAADNNHEPTEFAGLFAADAVWESDDFGVNHGIEELKVLAQRFRDTISFSRHHVLNPMIDVAGNRAHGVWSLIAMITLRADNSGMLICGQYDEDYVKLDGKWKFSHVRGIHLGSTPVPAPWHAHAEWSSVG